MTSLNEEKDWYEHRHDLREGDIFITHWDLKICLDRLIPGFSDAWYVVTCVNGNWCRNQDTIHASDLKTRTERHYG